MKDYEIVYIYDSALGEEGVGERVDRIHERIEKEGGELRAVDHWGRRRLAYPIASHENGYYVVAQFTAEPSLLPELERSLKLEESLLRHLIVIDEGQPTAPMSITTREPDEEDREEDDDEDDDEDEEE
ncbi:MAG: 30S ribosomal protein S6 [Gemmatimonadota bacterium]